MGVLSEIQKDLNLEVVALFGECHDALLSEARALCNDDSGAEDLVMRTFEAYCKSRDNFDPGKGSWLSWLRGIMRNLHHNSSRGKAVGCMVYMTPEELAQIQDREVGSGEADDAVLRNSDAEVVRNAIGGLSPDMREVIVLRYFEDLPISRIAQILGASENSVKCRLYYARKILAKRLGGKLGKKSLALLLAALLGVGTLFGAWFSPLGDWVAEKVFGSAPAEEERVQLNGIQTFAEPVCTEQMVGNVATASVVPQSAATKISNVQNTTKQESEQNMNIGSMIKSTVAATTVAAMGFAAQGETKVVRVVPNGEAGANPDGATWETAYGDIKTAYESLGAEGGEVWIKKGLYVMSNAVEMAANVSVYGGFAGTETSRAAADPKANTTLLTGDQELNDKLMTGSFRAWRYNTIVPAWDYETLTFNAQTPSFTADSRCNYYAWSAWPQYICDSTTPKMTSDDKSNQKVFDTLADTACAFYRTAETPSVGTVAFEGLVFSGFKTNVFNVAGSTGGETPDASHLVVRNCRFLACCNGLAGRGSSLFRPLYVRNMKTTVSGCEFSHCVNGINFAAPGLLTDETALVVSNCLFRYAFISDSGSVAISNANHPTPDASPKVHVADCTFTGNFNPAGDCCGVSVLANGLVERCTFTQNYGYEYPVKTLCIYGMDPNDGGGSPRLEVRDCRFVGNEIRNERGSNSTTAIMTGTASNFKTSSSGYPIVRNCYFADNKIVRYRVRKSYPNGVCYYQSGKCSLIFINCAAENNSIEYIGSEDGATDDISAAYNAMFVGKGIFVNCAVRGSKFIDSSTKALNPTFCEFTSKATFINTVVHNDNEDGNYTFALGTFLVYSTLATDRDDLSGISFSKTKLTANGTPMFRVQSVPDKRPGRAAWEIGYDIAVYDPDYDKTKPWRSFHDYRLGNDGCAKNPPAVLVDGLNDTEHLIPDANGKARYRMKNGVPKIGEAYGPLCASVDGISIFVK